MIRKSIRLKIVQYSANSANIKNLTEFDFFAYSTVMNYTSELSGRIGSYFISVFFEVLDKHGKTDDWDELVTKVSGVMEDRFNQIPEFVKRTKHKLAFVELDNKDVLKPEVEKHLLDHKQQLEQLQEQIQQMELTIQYQQRQLQTQQSIVGINLIYFYFSWSKYLYITIFKFYFLIISNTINRDKKKFSQQLNNNKFNFYKSNFNKFNKPYSNN